MEFKIEDFVLDRRFRSWVLDPDNDSNSYWKQYMTNHPNQTKAIEEARAIVLNLPDINHRLNPNEVAEMWQNISSTLNRKEIQDEKVIPLNHSKIIGQRISTKPQPNRNWAKYAASVVIIASTIAVWFLTKNETTAIVESQPEWIMKETLWGQKSTIYLSDGTEVILNSGSTIRFLKNFDAKERMVLLDGEAFFTVSKDTLRPFSVKTGEIITQALGTSFNIDAYHADTNVDISLVTGRVLVRSNDNEIFLNPGEKVVYKNQNRSFEKQIFDLVSTIGWKDRLLVFKDANQAQVFDKLSQWYGVEFIFDNSSEKTWNYNAEFKNLDLKNVLGSISFVMDFDFNIHDNLVNIKFNDP